MSLPVITVTRSWLGRPIVMWFASEHAMSRRDWTARATSRVAEIRGDHTSQDRLAATCTQALLADGVDLRWRATHRRGQRVREAITS